MDEEIDLEPIGVIVRRLESQLETAARNEQKLTNVWSSFDNEYWSERPDYRFWRNLGFPGFAQRGKKVHLAPRDTHIFVSASSIENKIRSAISESAGFHERNPIIQYGILGSTIEYLVEAKRAESEARNRRKRESKASNVDVPVDLSPFSASAALIADVLSHAAPGIVDHPPSTAGQSLVQFAVMSYLVGIQSHPVPSALYENYPELIVRNLGIIDTTFPPELHQVGLPRLKLAQILSGDEKGRLIPTRTEDQSKIFAHALQRSAYQLGRMAEERHQTDRYPKTLLTLRAALLIGAYGLFAWMRSIIVRSSQSGQIVGNNVENTIVHYQFQEASVLFDAAISAEYLDDDFLIAKLWSLYLGLWSDFLSKPPDYCFRLVKEAGFAAPAVTPKLDLRDLSIGAKAEYAPILSLRRTLPELEWRTARYEAKIQNCASHWQLLKSACSFPDEVSYWLIFSARFAYKLAKSVGLSEELAVSGFEVALECGQIECAFDFLRRISAPTADQVNRFAHNIRLALQWGQLLADPRYIEKWIDETVKALNRCTRFESISVSGRFYIHEVVMGRVTKLGGEVDDPEFRDAVVRVWRRNDGDTEAVDELRKRTLAGNVGSSELTVDDLKGRLRDISGAKSIKVVALSLLIMNNRISYVHVYPKDDVQRRTEFVTNHDSGDWMIFDSGDYENLLEEMRRLKEGLDVSHVSWREIIAWPSALMNLVRELYADWVRILGRPADHILLSVNAPFNEVPWQQLIAVAHSERRSTRQCPLVSIVPNFGLLRSQSLSTKFEAGMSFFPKEANIEDDIVAEACDCIARTRRRFEKHSSLSLSVIVGHGPRSEENGVNTGMLPRIMINKERALTEDEMRGCFKHEIVVIGSCRTGAPGKFSSSDFGGVLLWFFMEAEGMIIAPTGDVSPKSVCTLVSEVIKARGRVDVMECYRHAIEIDPECYFFNVYGIPFGVIAEESIGKLDYLLDS